MIKQLPTAIAFLNSDFELVQVSDKWIEDFEFNDKNIIGNTVFELFDNVGENWRKALEECLLGHHRSGQKSFVDSDFNERWFKWANVPWYDEDENIIGIIVRTEDITKKVEADMNFNKLESLVRAKSEIAKVGIWDYDIATNRLTWCNIAKTIYEVPADHEPTIDKTVAFYKNGYSRNTISMLVHNAMEHGSSFKRRMEIITHKGNPKWVMVAGKPIVTDNVITGLIGTVQDIDEQVQSELKTKENEKLLHILVNNLPLNVFVKDKDSRKVLVNKSECEHLGVNDPSEVIGKTDFDFYEKAVAQISRDEDIQVIKTLKPIIGKETISIRKDRKSTTFLTSKIPLLDTDGNAYGIIGLSMDITGLKEKENQLRDLINVTAIQNKKLINFAHIVSHDLRSHSANFSMLLNFLKEETDRDEKKRILGMLNRSSENLMVTLEDLNEVVDINTNVNLEKKPVNLNQLLKKILQNLQICFQDSQAKIINTIADDITVLSVPSYLESILLNLMSNAIKYRHPDRIPEIILSAKPEKEHTIFSIEDNGLGIDLKKYGEKLFGMYKTFHKHKDSRGIGLYITKNQIEAMGGNIFACSELNKGSTFKVYFKNETD
ncbi:MAG: PAS domain-containing protein [Bacteroidota bacterium]